VTNLSLDELDESTMYVSFHTVPGKTREVEQELQKIA
jgi:hypothetical protein